MKVIIDEETCIGCGTCVDICSEVFEMSGDIAIVKTQNIDEDLENDCVEAADSCPVDAIIIEE